MLMNFITSLVKRGDLIFYSRAEIIRLVLNSCEENQIISYRTVRLKQFHEEQIRSEWSNSFKSKDYKVCR